MHTHYAHTLCTHSMHTLYAHTLCTHSMHTLYAHTLCNWCTHEHAMHLVNPIKLTFQNLCFCLNSLKFSIFFSPIFIFHFLYLCQINLRIPIIPFPFLDIYFLLLFAIIYYSEYVNFSFFFWNLLQQASRKLTREIPVFLSPFLFCFIFVPG